MRDTRAADLRDLIERGRKLRDAGSWSEAISCYLAANEIDGSRYDIKHNLALSLIAASRAQEAKHILAQAIWLKPDLWPSHILKARMLKEQGEIEAADDVLMHVLKYAPQNGHALLAAADLDMNEFGDAVGARERVAPLLNNPIFKGEAELTTLMSKLYDREESDEELSYMLMEFAKRELSMPTFKYSDHALQGVPNRTGRKRVGLLSPMFCVSPVYFLTISTFRDLAKRFDLIVMNRGSKEDWGTQAFRDIAAEWHNVQNLEAHTLANAIKKQTLDVLFDLGGWSDPVGLKALSVKPATKMFKWVGGQSATTGITTFDGFITDRLHSPKGFEVIHSEPLLYLSGSYCKYSSPPYLPTATAEPELGDGIISNPVKCSTRFLTDLSQTKRSPIFIERRMQYQKTRRRIERFVKDAQYICPQSHQDYLNNIAKLRRVIDTYPYTAGLCALESIALGLGIETRSGKIFSSRHSVSHKGWNRSTQKMSISDQLSDLMNDKNDIGQF